MPPHRFAIGKVPDFSLAGRQFQDAQVAFALSDHSPFNDPHVLGNIGVEFLRPFRIALDYQQDRLIIGENDEK